MRENDGIEIYDIPCGTAISVEVQKGEDILSALSRTVKSLKERERYARHSDTAEFSPRCENVPDPVCSKEPMTFSFGVALSKLKHGCKVARKGWNGKGIFIELQVPDEHSKMTSPYIYIDTTGLRTDNADAPKSRVPWLASQTDMLAEDWVIVN